MAKARVSHSGRMKEDTVVTVTCLNSSHILMGETTITCQKDGNWTAVPECKKFGNLL